MADYDQRWIRRHGNGFRSASGKHAICGACGDAPRCALPRVQSACDVFLPVVSFTDGAGLYVGTFNTFRRGPGWHRRLAVGARVRLFVTSVEEFVGEARVAETHLGPLGPLLGRHAAMNHLLIEANHADADVRLLKILIRLYGRNYTQPNAPFSVIYLERS